MTRDDPHQQANDTLDGKVVNYFFFRLKRTFGADYKVKFPNERTENTAKAEWHDQISQLTRPQIDSGFTRLRQVMTEEPEKWRFPNVAKAIQLCKPRPEDYGMPPVDRAWREVEEHSHEPLEHNWSHQGVYIAGHYTGWFDIRNEENSFQRQTLKKKFIIEYHRVVLRIFTTGQVEPTQALEHQQTSLSETEKSNRYHQQQLERTMIQQGIHPKAGRDKSRQRLQSLGFLKEDA